MKNPSKAAAPVRIYPLKALREWIMALDAAMLVAVTSPEVGAVHKLRTATRRVEAHLALLEMLATGDRPLHLPPHRDEAEAVRKRLRRVRQAAGAVRDLDVQTGIIRSDAPEKGTVHKGSPGDRLRKEAKKLRKNLDAQRDHEAARLTETLKAEEQKLAAALDTLETALKPVDRQSISPTALTSRIEHWFVAEAHRVLRPKAIKGRTRQQALRAAIEGMDEDALHTLRKAAKLCRYMAESAPESSNVKALAERFESIQEAGGTWHDWLLLQWLSGDFHGKKCDLTQRYATHSAAALADYRLRLAEALPQLAA